VCSNQAIEGFTHRSDDKRTYESYSDYNTQKNDDNIRTVNFSDKRSSNFNNPFYNKANWQSDKDKQRYIDRQRERDRDRDRDGDRERDRTDLNAGDEKDRSNMNTRKTKYSEFNNSNFDSNTKLLDRLVGIFDSVSKGKMNAPMFNVSDTTTSTNANANEPQGVPKSRIPPGQENLYILKSEIVPPVCPACPQVNCGSCATAKKCPPCPPCARCPEPSFECKKVPNYNSVGLMNQLPIPWADKL